MTKAKDTNQTQLLLDLCDRCEERTATTELGKQNVCQYCFELEADTAYERMKDDD